MSFQIFANTISTMHYCILEGAVAWKSCLFSRGGSFVLPCISPPWPVFSHPESICITASFMRCGQCPIHTVCVCVGERESELRWMCVSLHYIFPFRLSVSCICVFVSVRVAHVHACCDRFWPVWVTFLPVCCRLIVRVSKRMVLVSICSELTLSPVSLHHLHGFY